jgi:CheY-like chemotaxis protein
MRGWVILQARQVLSPCGLRTTADTIQGSILADDTHIGGTDPDEWTPSEEIVPCADSKRHQKGTLMPHQFPAAHEAAPSAPRMAANSIRVLIADDDAAIRQLLEELLEDDGYTVIGTANGHQLVQMAQQHIPDLILVDLMMPQMDGYEAIRQLRNDTRTAHIPMLILTAQIHTRDVVVGFESGADDYITKPFDTAILLARIQSQLRRASQRPVNFQFAVDARSLFTLVSASVQLGDRSPPRLSHYSSKNG